MPSKTEGPESTSLTCRIVESTYPVVNVNGSYRCSTIPTETQRDNGTAVTFSRKRVRSWENSTPWPPVNLPKPVNSYTDVLERTVSKPIGFFYSNNGSVGGTGTCRLERRGMMHSANFRGDGALNVAPTLDLQDLEFCKSRAILGALLKAKDQKSMLLVTLAERKKTWSMVGDHVRRLARMRASFLRNLIRKKKGANPAKAGEELLAEVGKYLSPTNIHNVWLEGRYGWLPLLMDIKGGAELLASRMVDPLQKRFRDVVTRKSERQEIVDWNGFKWKGKVLVEYETTTTASCGGFLEVTNEDGRDLARAGVTNPLEVMWEILPYSFVVDWVVSVGKYVEAINATAGLTFKSTFLTTCVETRYRRTHAGDSNNGGDTWVYYPSPYCEAVKRSFTRDRYTPSLSDVALTSLFNVRMNDKRWIDSVALLAKLFHKGK